MKKTLAIILSALIMIMVVGCTKDGDTLKQKEDVKEGAFASTNIFNKDESGSDATTTESNTSTESTTTAEPNSPESTGGDSWSKDYD